MPGLNCNTRVLDHNECEANELYLAQLPHLFLKDQKKVQTLLEFAKSNGVTLRNLQPAEHAALLALLGQPVLSIPELNQWANGLYDAKAGQGASVEMHKNQAPDISDMLARGDMCLPTAWGSCQDYYGVMAAHTTLPENIHQPGIYALPIVGMEQILTLNEYIDPIKAKPGHYELLLPFVRDNKHWNLLEVSVSDGQITQATLWDSTNNSDPNRPHCLAISNQINHPVNVHAAGVQQNSHSCMDYVIYREQTQMAIINDITTATDEDSLRLAICNTLKPDAQIVMSQDDVHQQLVLNREQQENFDATLAQALAKEYKDCHISDAEAMSNAFTKVAAQFGFFATNKVGSALDNQPQNGHKSASSFR